MAKTLKDILEVAKPVSPADKAFVAKHTIKVTPDANKNGDDVFKGKTKTHKRSPNHGYDVGADEKVYEAAKAATLSALTGKASPIDDYADMIAKFKAKGGGVTKVAPKELDDKEKAKLSATFGKGGGKGGSALATGEFASMSKKDAAYNAKQALARRKSSGMKEETDLDEALTDKRVTTTDSEHKSAVGDLHRTLTKAGYKPQFQSRVGVGGMKNGTMDHLSNPDVAKDKSVNGHNVKYKNDNGHTVNMTIIHKGDIRDDRGDKTGNIKREVSIGKISKHSPDAPKRPNLPESVDLDEAVAKDHYDMHHKRAMSALNDIGKHLMKQKAMCDKSDNKWAHQDNAWAMKDMSRQLEDMMQNSAQRTENMMPVPTPKDSIRGY